MIRNRLKENQGAVLVLVAILMTVFIGFSALAIDIGNLVMVKNQLQNAADAGALAGAADLYNEFGTEINEGANLTAYTIATSNFANSVDGKVPVESHLNGNSGDIQRGHWSFATRVFTPVDSLEPTDLEGKTIEELDSDTSFVNAMRVVVRREDTPISSFFSGIFGYQDFAGSAEAVAYIGFAGQLDPGEADQPIGICRQSIEEDGVFSCNMGRMINSGTNAATNNTGGWTNFDQEDDPCKGGTNANEMKSLVCGGGNPEPIVYGKKMATTGGMMDSVFKEFYDCWASITNKTSSWNMTLPVIDCNNNNVGTCEKVVGAVNVNIVWINNQANNWDTVPTEMDEWWSDNPDGESRWGEFVEHFKLKNANDTAAPFQKKAIYFKPDCTPQELKGKTGVGGVNYGVMARIPVLVN